MGQSVRSSLHACIRHLPWISHMLHSIFMEGNFSSLVSSLRQSFHAYIWRSIWRFFWPLYGIFDLASASLTCLAREKKFTYQIHNEALRRKYYVFTSEEHCKKKLNVKQNAKEIFFFVCFQSCCDSRASSKCHLHSFKNSVLLLASPSNDFHLPILDYFCLLLADSAFFVFY